MNKDTTEKVSEGDIVEMLQTLEKKLRFLLGNPNWVFSFMETHSVNCAKFQLIFQEFANFQKLRVHKKKW